MSFLDNLENTLKNLESRDEQQDRREHEDRAAARARALAAAPYADELKSGAFTKELLSQATRIGFSQRVKVRITWIGSTLRLEAGEKKLELQPTAEGVEAGFHENGELLRSRKVDLAGNAEALAREWLEGAGRDA